MRRARKRTGRRRGAVLGAFSAAACLAALLAACGPASDAASGGATAAGTGNTVTYAMQPGGLATYIFPFISAFNSVDDNVYNLDDFQYLLYRPLYWFGKGTSPYLNPTLSLAEPPVYNGNEVYIHLKPNYKWSNGEPVDARDVVFFMNMMFAEAPTANTPGCKDGTDPADCKYWVGTTGDGLPGDVSDVRVVKKYIVAMHITTPKFSETWFTNNELSQITPMPMAWDKTAAGPSDCATRISSCGAVYDYLNQQSQSVSSYGTSSLWDVVDGPWKVKKLDPQGYLTLTFNNRYSGPVAKTHVTTFIETPYTTEQAEYEVLQDPLPGQTIDVGYLPTVDAPVPPAGANVGSNPASLSGYQLSVVYPWELSYFPYNFNNNTGQGKIFQQLYFRQAFQKLVDQEGVINGPLHGYGKANYGPVSAYPATKFLAPKVAAKGDRWKLNIGAAKALLLSHGWAAHSTGPDTCAHPGTAPGECGPGVKAGQSLTFTLMYATGIDYMESAVRELASNASLAGIKVNLSAQPFNNVVGDAFDPSNHSWQLAYWGSWTYQPDYLPTGDVLFENNSPNNAGAYDSPTDNADITKTLEARTSSQFYSAMYKWQDYLAGQLPVVYQPNTAILMEAINGLSIGPQNTALTITPEMWYYRK
jgi:peptide/nickel transport system substrate-binding protein